MGGRVVSMPVDFQSVILQFKLENRGSSLQVEGFGLDLMSSLRLRGQPDFIDAVHDTGLNLPRDVHHVQRE